MSFSYLPQKTYLDVNGGVIELIHEGQVLMSMTAGEARSNAADLIDAADTLEQKAPPAYRARAKAVASVAGEILAEYARASETFPPFNSAHEGYAVLLEETDELWEEVGLKKRNMPAMRKEAIQVAAMALRFVMDVCDGDRR